MSWDALSRMGLAVRPFAGPKPPAGHRASQFSASLRKTPAQARAYLADRFDGDVRRALFETHPDRGGDPDEFRKVQRARELIGS